MELDIIHNIDALSGLRMLPDNAIDCIVTSPPYFQMRDYGIETIAKTNENRIKFYLVKFQAFLQLFLLNFASLSVQMEYLSPF